MKKLFVAIRRGNNDEVKAILTNKPKLLSCTAKQPPKKDDGQSLLQVSLKTGNFEIAEYLLDMGADVNFIEKESCNEWLAPVLHDAIRTLIFSCQTMEKDADKFDRVYKIFNKMLTLGADPNAVDSYGNTCLGRAIMDAKQMIDHPFFEGKSSWAGEGLDDIGRDLVLTQIRSVFQALIDAGANINSSNSQRESAVYDIKNSRLESFDLF